MVESFCGMNLNCNKIDSLFVSETKALFKIWKGKRLFTKFPAIYPIFWTPVIIWSSSELIPSNNFRKRKKKILQNIYIFLTNFPDHLKSNIDIYEKTLWLPQGITECVFVPFIWLPKSGQ